MCDEIVNAAVTGWTSLEVAKLGVAALIPLTVVLLGWPVARAARRIEQAQWNSRKLIELRLEVFQEMARPLNDLFCFFRRVGDFQEITPPEALRRKRLLDKAFFVHRQLMSDAFADRYQEFMDACFVVYTGFARPALLRASLTQQRLERPNWSDEWDELLVPESQTPTGLAEIETRYDALMEQFRQDIGVNISMKGRRDV